MKQDWKPGTMIYPLPAVLVSCGSTEEEYNIITVAWAGTICTNPPMCYISVRPERHSYPILKRNMEFVINLTTRDMAFATDWCGVRSGRDYNKFQEMKLTPGKAKMVSAPIIEESPLCIECRVKEIISLGSHDMFIADVAPYTEQQYQFEVMKGDVDKVNTQTVVVVFLLVNVFLGLIGTFWFRTRRRRNEIALRLAMGSTKKQIFCLLMGEGLLLLTLVTLPAMIVCYNVGIAEFTMGHTELITTWPVKWSFLRFLLGSLGAWLLIALMVVIGIWFPARQAIKIQPAEALHEE